MEKQSIILSICICTHNRAPDVAECLAALMPQIDLRQAEVIILDSASGPQHVEKLTGLANRWPGISYTRSDVAGLSIARNLAIEKAKGDWIAFLDDDAVPFPDYFLNALETIYGLDQRVSFFGGRLKPRWPDQTVPDIGPMWMNFLSLIDDVTPIRHTEPGMIFGANLFYRRSVLKERPVPFDPALGRVGNCLLSGEEVNLHSALLNDGHECRYVGRIGAEHKVSRQRLSRRWIRERAYWDGITLIAISKIRNEAPHRATSLPRQIAKLIVLAPFLLLPDARGEKTANLFRSIGVLRARLFGIPKA